MSQNQLRAFLPKALLSSAHRLLEHHALVVEQASCFPQVVEILPVQELPAQIPCHAFPEEVWTVAPVLAHAHLESWDAPSAAWQRSSFSAWVQQLMAWRAGPRLMAGESAARSLAALARMGTACVAAHVGEAEAQLEGATTWASAASAVPALELGPAAWPQLLAWQEWLGAGEPQEPAAGCEGFALHAPYSVPMPQARALLERSKKRQQLLSIHLGEHAEEREFLQAGTGPMAEMVQARQGALPQERYASPVDWLAAAGGLGPGVLAVHGGDLSAEELQRLQQAEVSLVFCPGTHDYFARQTPAFVVAGGPLPALGCDSMASNACLDPLYELRLAYAQMPEPGPQAWWTALTLGGAEALRQSQLGHWRPGAHARVMRLCQPPQEAMDSAADLCAYLASGEALRVPEGTTPPC